MSTIFVTLLKNQRITQIRSALLRHPLSLPASVFEDLERQGILTVSSDNAFARSARCEAKSWEIFTAGLCEWDKTLLGRAEVQAALERAKSTLAECQRQHRPADDVKVRIEKNNWLAKMRKKIWKKNPEVVLASRDPKPDGSEQVAYMIRSFMSLRSLWGGTS